ncbi:transient receptor potential-gamma protein-like isoform X3 [Arctopsyche grandis]|uniref:transient receptor potential-gamma protein-like isoform X3 n=1 Tax=Arctopsyche grandis TaxID=121162 RepID=UPI00406D97F2
MRKRRAKNVTHKTLRLMMQRAQETEYINVNCVDPLGRSALLMAIDNENLEMVELLIEHRVQTRDALLHAISEEFVEAVEALLDHEETRHKFGELHSWEALPPDTATFTPDITPLILAAHRDNYEIIKILLDRGATLPMPHDVRCGCDECVTSRQEDSLRHSRSRINAYRALASPSLIALSSKDPILTAFELSWELRRLSFMEHEFKIEYQELRKQCQEFATALLDHTRSSHELEVLLNHDPTGPAFEHGERMQLNRLKLAIKLRQKKFVAHPNVQQLLASIWYEGLPGFRRKNMALQALEIVRIGMMFPLFSASYIIAPHSALGKTMRKPFIKFICHSASYFTFLFMLILASQRIETVIGGWLWGDTGPEKEDIPTKRGSPPSIVEWFILAWVSGLIWSEVKQLWDVGLEEYVNDMWNVIDFVTNSLYVATIALRIVAYYQVQREVALGWNTAESPREHWDAWDPMLLSEGLFSAANIFSSLKLVYIFSVNPHLGPLQVSLSRMVMDIMKFFFLYVLVLFAFSCGLNQLLWYYADMEKKRCPKENTYGSKMHDINSTKPEPDTNACVVWRRFANLFETIQTLFWAVFGLVDLDSFELDGIKIFTRFWGMLMFGTYSVINIVVLLNLLIAMMNHSYQLISERADIEWKFARSKLWISYFEEGGTVPPPFNIIPTPKSLWYASQWIQRKMCGHSRAKKEHMRTIRVKQASERDFRYQSIMRNLVRRYVTVQQRKAESQGVTEDDVNEIKQDISAFRCELVEILKNSGMNTSTASGAGSELSFSGSGGKKNRQKERRLMKGFNIAPSNNVTLPPVAEFIASLHHQHSEQGHTHGHEVFGSTFSGIFGGGGSVHKAPHHSLRTSQSSLSSEANPYHRGLALNMARFHPKRSSSHKRRWGTLIEAAKVGRVSKLIGRSRSEDSVCNSHCRQNSSHSHSNSPPSDNTDSPSDSNRSLERSQPPKSKYDTQTTPSEHRSHSHGISALVALKKKRKKFSDSRNASPDPPPHPPQPTKKILKRACSVPMRVADVVNPHPATVQCEDSTENIRPIDETGMTPSTTEESVGRSGTSRKSNNENKPSGSSLEPLLTSLDESSPHKTHRNVKSVVLPRLPGIIPLSGHTQPSGWL